MRVTISATGADVDFFPQRGPSSRWDQLLSKLYTRLSVEEKRGIVAAIRARDAALAQRLGDAVEAARSDLMTTSLYNPMKTSQSLQSISPIMRIDGAEQSSRP